MLMRRSTSGVTNPFGIDAIQIRPVWYLIMLSFLLPLAQKVIVDAVAKIPDNEELGEQLIKVCIVILEKAVKLTKTDMDDKLLAKVKDAIVAR